MYMFRMKDHNRVSSMTRRLICCLGLLSLLTIILSCGSAYYNTFFNARQAFNTAENTRKGSTKGRVDRGNYQKAIDKSLKVIEDYPNSKWYDDALFVLGVSYFYVGQPNKADRRFRELLANYENSEYTKDATVYLAKTKLAMGDEEDAMALFEEIFAAEFSKENRTQAAVSLGKYYVEKEQFDLATNYFLAVRDSLGDKDDQIQAQMSIAEGQYDGFRFGDALGSYLQLLGMDPNASIKYIALYQSAICAFRLQRISTGMDYLGRLMEDELYYDSLDVLNLVMAEGYEMDGDVDLASDLYAEVAGNEGNSKRTAYANYRLGLIQQFDYDDLIEAKKYYDLTVKSDRVTETGKDALRRSTDIGKLLTFTQRFERDSTVTQEIIDEAAYNQFLLAELYWFSLDKPDSAINEMRYLVDSFPDAYDTPNGMIALSQMYREAYEDSTGADSILNEMLRRYPHSDYVPDALEVLNLTKTEADTGYAEWYLHRAEDFLFDEENIDSARANYQVIIDNFVDSRFYIKAVFNQILLTELYQNPGDSTVFYAYQEFVDSFPGNEYAQVASQKIRTTPVSRFRSGDQEQEQDEDDEVFASDQQDDVSPSGLEVTGDYNTTFQSLYQRPNGDTIVLLDLTPVDIIEPFEFPESAFSMEDLFVQMFFHVLLDFSGTVIESELKTPSKWDELNIRADRTVRSMTFNPADVSTLIATLALPEDEEGRGTWFVFKYIINKPEFVR